MGLTTVQRDCAACDPDNLTEKSECCFKQKCQSNHMPVKYTKHI